LIVASVLLGAARAQTTWYVDVTASPPGDGSASAPFPTIQAGVSATAAGDHVSVAPGEYVENVLAPEHTLHVESQAGPLATILRAAGPRPAYHGVTTSSAMSTITGFTFTDSEIGLRGAGLQANYCLIYGNDIGVESHDLSLWRCTIAGNHIGIQDNGYFGVVGTECVVSLNTNYDYFAGGTPRFAAFYDCVGFQKSFSFIYFHLSHTLQANPLLWDLPSGNLHLQPGSPCIGYLPGSDVGALEFDPSYGADFQSAGGGLAGSTGTPVLSADGYMLAGTTVTLSLGNGLPGAAAVLVVGLTQQGAPFKGGTLVPHPDLLLPLALDGSGQLALGFVWPAGVPSGRSVWSQAWLHDAQGPQGYAASNGLKFTTP